MFQYSGAEFVQAEDWARQDLTTTTTVFFIHDGGGTTFAYHCLEPLYRHAYAIGNPCFFSGEAFPGGLPAMGRLYAEWIRDAVAKRDFPARRNRDGGVDLLLGGWSLGGLLSLQIAMELEAVADVNVVGILMIDSVYPRWSTEIAYLPLLRSSIEGESKNEQLCRLAMDHAVDIVKAWNIPQFLGKQPPTILLRATDCVPRDEPGVTIVDGYREDARLGWDNFSKTMFAEVMDVQGHHFDILSLERVQATTRVVREALDQLDTVQPAK